MRDAGAGFRATGLGLGFGVRSLARTGKDGLRTNALSKLIHNADGTHKTGAKAWAARQIAEWTGTKACFVAGVPVLTRGGSKAIEELLDYETHGDACDWVLSRDEYEANGELVWRRVLRRFVRQSLVLNLHVRGQLIGTTAEHPFFVSSAGWTPAHSLRIGDVLLSHDGQRIAVDGVADSGRIETVYNVEVEHDHTYFVGCDQTWGFSVWAHNRGCTPEEFARYQAMAADERLHPMARLAARDIVAQEVAAASAQARAANAARQQAWAGNMDQINGTMAGLARRALREGGGDWQRAEAALARYAEAMNARFQQVGSTKRAVIDATVENGSGLRNRGYGTRAEPWVTNPDGSIARYPNGRPIPTGDTSRIELGIVSTAMTDNPVLSAVDISYNYRKAFEWAKYTDAFGHNVPIADIRMSRNLWNRSDPILNYVEWRRGGAVTSRTEFGRQGLPNGW